MVFDPHLCHREACFEWNVCVPALQVQSFDGLIFLELLSCMDLACGTRFIMDGIAFHKSSIEWNGVRFCMRQTAQSATGSRKPGPPSQI